MKLKLLICGLLLLAVWAVGCGSHSAPSSTTPTPPQQQQAAMVMGPWNGSTTSSQGNGSSLVFANIQNQGAGSFFAVSNATLLCLKFNASCFTSLPQESSLGPVYAMTGSVANGNQVTLTISITTSMGSSAGNISATGTLSTDGKSITGSYTESGAVTDAGTFAANVVGAVSGTYSGSLTSSNSSFAPFPVTATITEATDGTLTGTASISNSPCVSTLTFQNGGPENNYVIGGAFQVAQPSPIVWADVIPNGDGTFSVTYNIQTPTCSDSGTGTVTKH